MRVTRICALGVIALVGIVLGTFSSAQAICNPGRGGGSLGSQLDGALQQSSSAVTSAVAVISGYTPYVDFAHGGDVSAWSMIAKSSCAAGGFIQVGQAENLHGETDSFYEAADCNHIYPPVEYSTPPYPSKHKYRVDLSPSSGSFALYVDVTKVYAGNVDWNHGDQIQLFGETHAQDDQMYGARNVPGTFSSSQLCTYSSGYSCNDVILAGFMQAQVQQNWFFYSRPAGSGTMSIGDTACAT